MISRELFNRYCRARVYSAGTVVIRGRRTGKDKQRHRGWWIAFLSWPTKPSAQSAVLAGWLVVVDAQRAWWSRGWLAFDGVRTGSRVGRRKRRAGNRVGGGLLGCGVWKCFAMAERDTDALLVGVELVGFGLLTRTGAGCKLQPVAGVRGALAGKEIHRGTCAGLPLGSADWLTLSSHVIWTLLHFRCMLLRRDSSSTKQV
jgi:hypothetical protein